MFINKKLSRKLRKLKNNPRLFFKDFFRKNYNLLRNKFYLFIPRIRDGSVKFTVISAVYNVSEYLDDYFYSLVNQRLDFRNSIQVICVDDGSTDNSKDVILKWVEKYPKNIFYIKKKNGGQASARNLGILNIKTEWVTFIDPDDFLDINYFYLIKEQISNEENVNALITKFKLFKEKFGTYHDGFQTDFCFSKPIRVLSCLDLEDCVQFSSSSSIYRTDIIKKNNITFDERLTASFEDTKFFYEYLYHTNGNGKIIYIKDALYYYRLRATENSSSNNQWKKKAKYKEFFDCGVINIIEKFNDKYGYLPEYIQRMVLFSIIPYLQVASINKNRIESVLNSSEIDNLLSTIKYCLSYINRNVLEKFFTPPGNYYWICSILNYFFDSEPNNQRVYVNKVCLEENKVWFRFYGLKGKTSFSVKVNGNEISSVSERVINHYIFNDLLINEFNICYIIPRDVSLEIYINSKQCGIFTDFKKLELKDIDFWGGYINKANQFKDIAIFMDSGHKADDNAEHLYRFWMGCAKDKKIKYYYLLDKDSHHWDRLFYEGFNLVDVKSLRAIHLIKSAKYIFCSYLPGHFNEWVSGHSFKFQKYIFLQHGVITSNLSRPFNASYSQVYKMVISTNFEKSEIMDDKYNYIYHDSDIIPSIIPRFQSLMELSNNSSNSRKRKVHKKRILICPTWRTELSGLNLGLSNNIELLFNSDYMMNWVGLLQSNELLRHIDKNTIEVAFVPHLNLYDMLDSSDLINSFKEKIDDRIKILDPKRVKYQELFINSDLLITDYSSLHFDFAFLNKPVIYFQFDSDKFYGISHAYQKGIFDFEKHGFGYIVKDLDELIVKLSNYIRSGNKFFRKYSSRKRDVFLSHINESDRFSSDMIYNYTFNSDEDA